MAKCLPKQARDKAIADCKKLGPVGAFGGGPCANARLKLCPPADEEPIVEQGKDGIILLGPWQYRGCEQTPELAPYPPGRPMPNEARAQTALERMQTQGVKQSAEIMKLRSRALRARKLELSAGFWLGLGLCGVGGALLFIKR